MSSNTTDGCAPDDQLCLTVKHELAVIIVPTILMFIFVVFLIWMFLLKYCHKEKASAAAYSSAHYQVNQQQQQRQPHRHDNRHPNHHPSHHQNHHSDHNRDNRQQSHHRDNHQRKHHEPQPRRSSPHRNHHHSRNRQRSHLQGIDAPLGINPLEHEEVPMTVQPSPQTNARPQAAAVRRQATERQHRAFSQIAALPQTFFISPDDPVSLYRAQMDRRDVVLRVLKDSASAAEREQFLGFASFLSGLGPNPFIPELLGAITVQPPLMIAIEELQHRDLLSFLWKCRQNNSEPECDMTEKRIYIMGRQVASALDYLHSRQCVHGNVAARSMLVGRDLTVKLWGLGPAYRRARTQASGAVNTLGSSDAMELRKWQAPEVLARSGIGPSSDVWSFGILLYELVTLGDPPFPQLMATELLQHLQRGKFFRKPSACSNALFSLIKSCCQWSPQQRLSLPELSRKLESGERTAGGTAVLRVPETLEIGQYLREAGYGEAFNYAVF